MPVQKVIVIHNSQEYVDDVNELREYVMGELNCMELEVTTAEVGTCGWCLSIEKIVSHLAVELSDNPPLWFSPYTLLPSSRTTKQG